MPTGVVKKVRRPDEDDDNVSFIFIVTYISILQFFSILQEKKDAWSQYMSEVKKYKERLGDEEEKNRPLVK